MWPTIFLFGTSKFNILCPNLKKLTFGSTNIKFMFCCFANCPKLTEIDFGSGNHNFQAGSFANCTKLEKLIMPNQTPPLNFHLVFEGCKYLETIICANNDVIAEFNKFKENEIPDESPPELPEPPKLVAEIEEEEEDSDPKYEKDEFVPFGDMATPPGTPRINVHTKAVRARPGTSGTRGGRKPSYSKKKKSAKKSQKKSASSKKGSKKKKSVSSKKGSKKKTSRKK